jgi:peptidoglycan/xylan/chitin deacetylase (PgdA/CDA1 family)
MIPAIATSAGAVAAGGVGFLAWAARGRSSNLFAPSLWRGSSDRPAIALTFDDGPSESTPQLLRLLAQNNTPATFFQCGANVRRLPGIAREAMEAGHEIGNHSETHARLWLRSPAFVLEEVSRGQHSIEDAVGLTPRWFRAPYGVRWFGLDRAQRRFGLTGVMWTVIGLDWKLPADRIADRLLRGANNGVIFCLHDGRELEIRPEIGETLAALRRVLPILRDKGYHFETVSEILCPTT